MPGPLQMGSSKKAKSFKASMQKLIVYCKKHVPLIVISIILASVGAVLTLVGPNKIGDITNEISKIFDPFSGGMNLDVITSTALTLVLIYAISALFTYIQGYIMAGLTQNICKSLRADLSRKINNLPLKYFDKHPYGDTLSRVTNDVDTIGQTLNTSIAQLIAGIVLLLGAIVMMFVTNWIMALSAIVASVLGFGLMGAIIKKSQKHFSNQQKNLGKLNGHIEEIYSSQNTIKLYNAKSKSRKDFDVLNENLAKSNLKSQFFAGLLMPLMSFVGNLGYVVVCVVGAVLCAKGQIAIGTIISFMIYVRLFTQPLVTIATGSASLQGTAAASERVFEFLAEEELENEQNKTAALEPSHIKGEVEFKNVAFGYTAEKQVINNFSAHIMPGQKVAIVGHTGAGKTTIVNLLMRFYDIKQGQILIDGQNTQELTRDNVHNLFSMVLQDTWLFEGTIKENIMYSKTDVKDEEIINACKKTGLLHFIESLPQKFDTVLDDMVSLSNGQKQLLTIARAMVQNSPMLILDEATSSVDTRTEVQIQKAMDELTKGRTSFIIAHRLSTIKNADLILVMRDGDIVESGTHKQLLKQNGAYAELYNSQFEE